LTGAGTFVESGEGEKVQNVPHGIPSDSTDRVSAVVILDAAGGEVVSRVVEPGIRQMLLAPDRILLKTMTWTRTGKDSIEAGGAI